MKIALVGYGKMGKEIEKLILDDNNEISFKITSKNKDQLSRITKENTDVAIEFSRPDMAFDNISFLLKKGVPVVSGTTAWLDKLEEAKENAIANDTALFYAPNFSLGVNIYFNINKHLALLMNDQSNYALTIEEIHHTQKLDSPSGTAVRIAEDIISCSENKKEWLNEESAKKDVVPIISKRISGVPGTHIVSYKSGIDEISLSHTAYSRKGFAVGAYLASKFIVDKVGYYEMKDLLGF